MKQYLQHTKTDSIHRTICNWASPVHSFDCHSCPHSQYSQQSTTRCYLPNQATEHDALNHASKKTNTRTARLQH